MFSKNVDFAFMTCYAEVSLRINDKIVLCVAFSKQYETKYTVKYTSVNSKRCELPSLLV